MTAPPTPTTGPADPFAASRVVDAALPAVRTSTSEHLGWTSALVRTYREDPETDRFDLPASDNPQLVTVTGGVYRLESRGAGTWRRSVYRVGSTGLTPPGTGNTLRWRTLGGEPLTSVHLHVAAAVWDEVAGELPSTRRTGFPNVLVDHDPVVASLVHTLRVAAARGAPSLYADSVVHLLCVHLQVRAAFADPVAAPAGLGARPLDRVVAYMDRHLAHDVTLEALAAEAGLSKYHFLRQFKAATGSTPFAFLAALRMQRAATLLGRGGHTVDGVARACGYRNASRFAAAFRRHHGVPPSRYRDSR